jgi:hypothetical protein
MQDNATKEETDDGNGMQSTFSECICPSLKIERRHLGLTYPGMFLFVNEERIGLCITEMAQDTHKQIFRRHSCVRVFIQAVIHEFLGLLWESPFWCQSWRGLIDDMLKQLQNTHGHSTTLQTDSFALSLVLLRGLWFRRTRR